MKRYWAYLDDTGLIRIKPYTTDRIIQNTEQLPFCKGIFDPFLAENMLDARRKIMQFLDQHKYYDKRNKK